LQRSICKELLVTRCDYYLLRSTMARLPYLHTTLRLSTNQRGVYPYTQDLSVINAHCPLGTLLLNVLVRE